MDSPNSLLLNKILAFEIDDPDSEMPFTTRLAREQRWTHAYAGRVITEYKRFIALAMVAGHSVTPSEDVDQVWHLHLAYTRSYWHDFCRDVLGREIHHGPTKGGESEGDKFLNWYSATLESYERIFEETAPAEIWPSPEERFVAAGSGRWVDDSCHFVIPFPRFLKLLFRR